MAPAPDSLDDGDHAHNNRLSWVSSSSSSSSASQTEEAYASRRRWGSVKTWMFGQLLASSFARVSLQEEPHATEGDDTNRKKTSTAASSATVSTSSSCSSLASLVPPASSTSTTTTASVSSSGGNDWDCSYTSLSAKRSNQEPPKPSVQSGATRYEFDICRVIGSGSYGTVLLTRLHDDPTKLFAIKMVPKNKLTLDRENRETLRVLTEKNVLASVDHPFITRLYCAFETSHSLNFVMEYCAGGDMYFLLENFAKNRMPEQLVVFYAASIALALSYLHQRGIIYRDLKPENLLLDHQGFLRLADFGFAREHMQPREQSCKTFCGSADYIAPEVVAGTGYGLSADLWSLGCVLYELLTGFPPFYSPRDRSVLFQKIANAEPSYPKYISADARDLLSKLLHKDASKRLGSGPNGMGDVFAHPFFSSIDWYQLSAKQVVPPFVPKLSSPGDTSNFEAQYTSQHVDGSVVYEEKPSGELQQALASGGDPARLFDDFDWCAETSAFA